MRVVTGLLSVGMLITACAAQAQYPTASAIREEARERLAELRKELDGDPGRCTLGVYLTTDLQVAWRSPVSTSGLAEGDSLLSVDGVTVQGKPLSAVGSIVRSKPPGAALRLEVSRGGSTVAVDGKCGDNRDRRRRLIDVVERKTREDFKGCLAAVKTAMQTDQNSAELQYHYSDCYLIVNPDDRGSIARNAYDYVRLVIQEAGTDANALDNARVEVLARRAYFRADGQSALYEDLEQTLEAAIARAGGATAAPAERSGVVATGTGFFVDGSGLLVTSQHVVRDAGRIAITMSTGEVREAKVVASSVATDIAVLKVEGSAPAYLTFAPPRRTAPGDRVFTYGYPVVGILGQEPKFTEGVVSALSGIQGEQSLLQTTVSIQPGNSGGPLVAEDATVVGVIASQAALEPFLQGTGTLPQNVNFAVKSDYAALALPNLSSQAPAASRQAAIDRVRKAICLVQVIR